MPKALYAGSFDPFTTGHLNVLIQASKVFEKVYLVIAVNSEKQRRIDKDIMKNAVEKVIQNRNIPNVEVLIYEGLTVDIAKEKSAEFLVRGLRNGTDYQYEENIASINNKIAGIETIYFRAGKTSDISSSMVMELKKYDRDISNLVPKEVLDIL